MKKLKNISIPVHFVCKGSNQFLDEINSSTREKFSEFYSRLEGGVNVWIIQTYLRLQERGFPVTISNQYEKNVINVIHYDNNRPEFSLRNFFTVTIRADRDPTFITDLEIVQNQLSMTSLRQYYIPHWPQPGLISRNKERKSKIENIVYMGAIQNLSLKFRSKCFINTLKSLGVNFRIETHNWWDYSEVDLVLAVRDGKTLFLSSKPASKLVNSWKANCPALLGVEPAYREIGTNNVDYFEITTPEDVYEIIKKIQIKPDVYQKIITAGANRVKKFTYNSITDEWILFFEEIASEHYHLWSKGGASLDVFRFCRYAYKMSRRRLWGCQNYPGCDKKGNLLKESWIGKLRRALFKL